MNEKKKNNKPLVALLVVAIVGVIGFTFAYFSDKITVNNEFQTKPYGTTVTEVFTSPENWTPGTETAKTVKTKNSGEVDEAVRVSYTEEWKSADGTVLPLEITVGEETSEPEPLGGGNYEGGFEDDPLEYEEPSSSTTTERAAIINFDNLYDSITGNGDWIKSNENGKDYYYYNKKLAQGEETSSFIKSVKFNENVESSSANNCETTTSEDGKTKTIECKTTKKGYDGATYTLTITVETVQYDQYKAAWGTNVTITDPSAPAQP